MAYFTAMDRFTYHRRVSFSDTDAAGIVHFSAFLRYAEDAEHALLRECGFPVSVDGSQFRWPRVTCSWECGDPLHFDEVVKLEPGIETFGTSSIAWRWVFTRLSDGEGAGVVRMKTVCAELLSGKGMRSVQLPKALQTALSPYLLPS